MSENERRDWYEKKLGPYERQIRESASRHKVPEQLLAAIVLNELADIGLVDIVQEELPISSGSLGIAQIQIDTAIQHNLIPGITDNDALNDQDRRLQVAAALKVPQIAIDAAAKEIHILLVKAGENAWTSDWQQWIEYPMVLAQPHDPQIYYQYVYGPAQSHREQNLARMMSGAYNSPNILTARNRHNFPNAKIHGANAASIAKDLYEFGLFRPSK
jgi:hypothetical protein